ncbi:MAG: hypothetical protein COB53_09090 [Elusimicrobia bacterium]|nr:MAG: hypothetical protein COB53_09090 [Elusimicrobiota bacterium]
MRDFTALIPALVVPGLGAVCAYTLASPGTVAKTVFAVSKLFIVLWPACWVLGIDKVSPRELISMEGLTRAHTWRKGFAIGIFFSIVLVSMYSLFFAALLIPERENIRAAITAWGSLKFYWVWALLMSLAHSGVEEIYWRGFVYTRLQRVCKPITAMAVGSVVFSIHHGVLYGKTLGIPVAVLFATGVSLAGGIWCVLVRDEKTLWPSWISHVVTDLALFSLGAHLLGLPPF